MPMDAFCLDCGVCRYSASISSRYYTNLKNHGSVCSRSLGQPNEWSNWVAVALWANSSPDILEPEYCCQCLTKYDCYGMFRKSFSFQDNACEQCKAMDNQWMWVKCSQEGFYPWFWQRVSRDQGISYTMPTLTIDTIDISSCTALEFPKHIISFPAWVLNCGRLRHLDVGKCSILENLPLRDLVGISSLEYLDCYGCTKLGSLPDELKTQGGRKIMLFVRESQFAGQYSSEMNIFMLGDAMAGKTSVVAALKSEGNAATYIRADQRTIGINICRWKTKTDITFSVFDLAGQAIYAKTHQFFLLRRAIYVLVWPAIISADRLHDYIKYWLGCLHCRLPGSSVILVATHIDCVDVRDLSVMCDQAQEAVSTWLRSNPATTTPALNICMDGQSVQVNCLSGVGIQKLRDLLEEHTMTRTWFRESLPLSWVRFRKELEQIRNNEPYLTWAKYENVAFSFGIDSDALNSVTSYFHSVGVVRYFRNDRGNPNDTVYISLPWMMNVMKGIFRHDRQALLDFFSENKNKKMLHYANRLNQCGVMNCCLIPFLWPCMEESKEFWSKNIQNSYDKEIWAANVVSNQEDAERALSLLVAYDLAVQHNDDFFLPGLMPPTKLPDKVMWWLMHPWDSRKKIEDSSPREKVETRPREMAEHSLVAYFTYMSIPPGFFDTIIVKLFKESLHKTKDYTSSKESVILNCDSSYAVFYNGSDFLIQMFCFQWIENDGKTITNTKTNRLVLLASSEKIIDMGIGVIHDVENFYSGISRLHFSKCVIPKTKDLEISRYYRHPPRHFCTECQNGMTKMQLDSKLHFVERDALVRQWSDNINLNIDQVKEGKVVCQSCANESKCDILAILTRFYVPNLRLCPYCWIDYRGPYMHGSFDAGVSRLKLNRNVRSRNEAETCFSCLTAGRHSQPKIQDIRPPEAFVFGHSSAPALIKKSIHNFTRAIELEADVLCSLDLPYPGEPAPVKYPSINPCWSFSNMKREKIRVVHSSNEFCCSFLTSTYSSEIGRSNKKMKDFLETLKSLDQKKDDSIAEYRAEYNRVERIHKKDLDLSLFLVILLSDSFMQSKECKSHLIRALYAAKHIVPVLIPNACRETDEDLSCVWSGPMDQNYWRHMLELDPGEKRWALMQHFPPLHFDRPPNFDSEQVLQNAGGKVAEVINESLIRPDKIVHYSTLSKIGVKLSFFEEFIQRRGGRDKFEGRTTFDVIEMFIKPETYDSKMSYCQHLQSNGLSEYVGNADWFYSHAWRCLFLDVADSAKLYFEDKGQDPFIWFDAFSVSQHCTDTRPFEWWNSIFLNTIGEIRQVLMFMQPFEDPASSTPAWITLTRVWCVFELYACESTAGRLEIVMTEKMRAQLQEAFDSFDPTFIDTLANLDCGKCEATVEEDRLRVFEVIQQTMGFPLLNSIVIQVVEQWLCTECIEQSRRDDSTDKTVSSKWFKCLRELCGKNHLNRSKNLGEEHPHTVRSKAFESRIRDAEMDPGCIDLLIRFLHHSQNPESD